MGDTRMSDAPGLGGEEDIEALCALIDDIPGHEDERPRDIANDVSDLLGCLAAAEDAQHGSSASGTRKPPSSLSLPHRGRLDSTLPDGAGDAESALVEREPDLPEPIADPPSEVILIPFVLSGFFDLRSEIDLKAVAFGIRHAEFNPRKQTSVTLRLIKPRATALVRASGKCTISTAAGLEEMRASAKKIARLIQRCGQNGVQFKDYRVTSILCKADLRFPVRLESLAQAWRRHAVYEPEMYSGCVFRTWSPRCTYLITAGGKVMISGCNSLDAAQMALRRIFPVLREFQH